MKQATFISMTWSMFKLTIIGLGLLLGLGSWRAQAQTQSNTVSTEAVGFVTINIAAGTGTARKTSIISIPLLDIDRTIPSKGTVTGIKNSRTLTVSPSNLGDNGQATFPAGYLSNTNSPFVLQMSSGASEGLMFLVSSSTPNTTNEITLTDPNDPSLNLSSTGITNGDKFNIYPCDTLLSFFGTPASTPIRGGTTQTNSDTVVLVSNGATATYFYNTSLGRWTRVALGNPNANNTPLMPYYGIQYMRLANTPMNLVVTGQVPTSKRKVKIKNQGTTLLASYWPSDVTLRNVGLQSLPNWLSSTNSSQADSVTTMANGSASTFTFDGLNWRRSSLGKPLSDSNIIFPAQGALINRRVNNSSYAILEQSPPYQF